MFYSPIIADSQFRLWAAHGDRIPGVRLTRSPEDDHDEVQRLGAFTRPLCHDEAIDSLLRPLEHPVVVVQRTCDPRVVKRSYWAAPPKLAPWPKEGRRPHRRALDRRLIAKWRRP